MLYLLKKLGKLFSKKGMTLVELTIGLAVISIITASVAPFYIKQAHIKAADKTALEMVAIQEAARVYYINNNSWPVDISALQNGGYLNSSWVTNNPWNNPYSVSSTANLLTVLSNVDAEWTETVASGLPSAVKNGTTITSTIPVPGGTTTEVVKVVGNDDVPMSPFRTTYHLLKDMSIVYYASGTRDVKILFTGSFEVAAPDDRFIYAAIFIDGVYRISGYANFYTDAVEDKAIPLLWAEKLSQGFHTIEVRWRLNTTAVDRVTQWGGTHSERILMVE